MMKYFISNRTDGRHAANAYRMLSCTGLCGEGSGRSSRVDNRRRYNRRRYSRTRSGTARSLSLFEEELLGREAVLGMPLVLLAGLEFIPLAVAGAAAVA